MTVDAVDLAFAGIARQAELVRGGSVSSRELVELYLDRIDRHDRGLNSFRTVLGDRALADAAAADRRRAAGETAALLGVPIAVKDVEDITGEITTFGTGGFSRPARSDSELVARLRDAGAVVIGKTNLPELAICGFTESRTWGTTRNPWRPDRTPGGSSGGSGAAVAAGLVGVATATDGAGSIRIPAAFCGLFGLKPQWGRVMVQPANHWYCLTVGGCVSRSVLDSALFLDVTARSGGAGVPPPDRLYVEAARTPPGRLRIAISDRPPRLIVPPIVTGEVRSPLESIAQTLSSLGHQVRREDPSYRLAGNNFVPRYLRGIHDELAAVPHPERLEARTRGFGRLGSLYPAPVARRARTAARGDARRINELFGRTDVVVTPTVGEAPIEVGRWKGRSAVRTLLGMGRTYCFTPIWNHTGQPAASVPAGFTAAGLPLAVQLIGPPNGEELLISLAAQLEAELRWTERRPPGSS